MSRREHGILAVKVGGVGIFMMANLIAQSATYACVLNDDLGPRGCVGWGLAVAWAAGWLTFSHHDWIERMPDEKG